MSTITYRKRSLTADGLIDRCRLWIRLMDLLGDPDARALADRLAEDLDSAYTELTHQAYMDGIEDGREMGAAHAAETIRGLRQDVTALEQHITCLIGTPDEASTITH